MFPPSPPLFPPSLLLLSFLFSPLSLPPPFLLPPPSSLLPPFLPPSSLPPPSFLPPSLQQTAVQGPPLTIINFDVLGSYSCWQCVELLLSHLPLLRTLFTLLLGAFRKVKTVCSYR